MDFKGHMLITGANGFIGRALCKRLCNDNLRIRGAVRRVDTDFFPKGMEIVSVGDIGPHTDWSQALQGVEVVVHLAGRVHVMKDSAQDRLVEYRYVNTQGTKRLAEMAAVAGVRRFIYASSIKVNGEETHKRPFSETGVPCPQDPYAVSKLEAEQALQDIARQTRLEIVILRPPLVYGPEVRANFLKLIKIVDRGIPLPLKNIHNARSMIYIGNIVDAIIACCAHDSAPGQTFMVCDNETISTPELILHIARALEKNPRLFPFPQAWLIAIGTILKKRAAAMRLLGSLTISNTKIQRTLNWNPPFAMQEGLRLTVAWYAQNKTIV